MYVFLATQINLKSRIVCLQRFSTTSLTRHQQGRRENIFTTPNALTCFRMFVLSPALYHCITTQQLPTALTILALAATTDYLDGFIARKYNSHTVMGSILDPLADKVLMTSLVVSLAQSSLLPIPTAAIILGRDALLVLGTFVIRYKSLDPPITLQRYFDMTRPSVHVTPPLISKINTALQLALMWSSLAAPVFGGMMHQHWVLLDALGVVVCCTTIWSGLHYLIGSNSFRFINKRLAISNLVVKSKKFLKRRP